MSQPLISALDALLEAVKDNATAPELRSLRDRLDSWLVRENVRIALHGVNNPENIAAIRDGLRRLQRGTEEVLALRENQRETVRLLGLGGGAGVTGGAIITAITMTFPVIAIIPAAAGIFAMWRAEATSRRFTEEIQLLGQIAEIAKQLAES